MHHHSKLAAAAVLGPLAAMAQVSASPQAPFSILIQSTNPALDGRYLSLYHSSAANSYLTVGGTTVPDPTSIFTFGQDPYYFGTMQVLQTTGIYGGNKTSDCDFATILDLNAGPFQCGVDVTNTTGNYAAIGVTQSGLGVAGIKAFYVCDTLASGGLIPSTIVGSTDGNAPNATARPTGQDKTFFSNCQPLAGSIQMRYASSTPSSSSSSSSSPASSSSSSVSAPTAPASAPTDTTVTSTIISTTTSSCDSSTTTSYSQPITVQPITVQSTVSSNQGTPSSFTATTLTPLLPVTGTPATSLPRISQIGDGQIQATTAVTSAPALFTGAANMLGHGRDLVMLAAGAAAFVMV